MHSLSCRNIAPRPTSDASILNTNCHLGLEAVKLVYLQSVYYKLSLDYLPKQPCCALLSSSGLSQVLLWLDKNIVNIVCNTLHSCQQFSHPTDWGGTRIHHTKGHLQKILHGIWSIESIFKHIFCCIKREGIAEWLRPQFVVSKGLSSRPR